MEEISCVLCGLMSHDVAIADNGYTGMRCPECGLIYISPRPQLSEIINLYCHDHAHISAENHISGSFTKRLYAKHNLHLIRKYIDKGSMLEIGAGAGYFIDEARKIGFEPYSIEFNRIQAAFIRDKLGIPCEEIPLDPYLFDEREFDIICHFDVLSHFFEPIDEFRKMNSRLRDKGYFMFETGNTADIDEKYLKYIPDFQYPDHLFFFGENNIRDLLDRTGFELVEIHRYSIMPQLMMIKVLFGMMGDSCRKISGLNGSSGYGNSCITNNRSSFKRQMLNLYGLICYLFRYVLGFLVPKRGRPQTILVIARKK
ncbi:MAG: class I SAM-dependent methyltransferase [Thermoplasmatota archaeon]